jgi:hypothetical protein
VHRHLLLQIRLLLRLESVAERSRGRGRMPFAAAMADEPGSGKAVAAERGTERKRAGEVGRMAFAAGNSHTARHAGERIDPCPA